MRVTVGERVTSRAFPRFVLVGGIGFLVDASILTMLMTGFGFDHYSARAISFTAAVTATWYMNRRWVFNRRTVRISGREYTAYLLVQVTGAVINLSLFALIIELLPRFAELPVIPLAAGAAAALLFNFTAASRLVFPGADEQAAGRDGSRS